MFRPQEYPRLLSSYRNAAAHGHYTEALSFGLLALLTGLFLTNNQTYLLIERPLQSSVVGFVFSGLALVVTELAFKRLSKSSTATSNRTIFELGALRKSPDEKFLSIQRPLGLASGKSPARDGLLVSYSAVVSSIVARVLLFTALQDLKQCSVPGVEALLPLLLFLGENIQLTKQLKPPMSFMFNELPIKRTSFFYIQILPAALLAFSNVLTSRLVSYPRSTFICPVAPDAKSLTLSLQIGSLFFDLAIFLFAKAFLRRLHDQSPTTSGSAPLFLGTILIVSAIVLSIFTPLVVIVGRSYSVTPKDESIFVLANLDGVHFISILSASLLFAGMVLVSIRTLLLDSAYELSLRFSVFIILIGVYKSMWTVPFSRVNAYSSIPPVFLLLLTIFLHSRSSLDLKSIRPRINARPSRYLAYVICVIIAFAFLRRSFKAHTLTIPLLDHPINGLIHEAAERHKLWLMQASKSSTLEEAVREYGRRYNRVPPPGFREWYEYAIAKSSLIIDDFDTIHDNLLPFWSLDPMMIRLRMNSIVGNPWNEVASVKVRSGAADLGNVQPTHRWMVEGIIRMMDPFVKYLPDMDIAFNINDESRVAIPYSTMMKFREEAEGAKRLLIKSDSWSLNRAKQLNESEELSTDAVIVENASFERTFDRFGSIGCPPTSLARRSHVWDTSTLCTICVEPHSRSTFLANWTLAASPCHQPDLANLHGFYLSPSAFKTTKELVPVFSQSRPHGYADILYPSAWNYNDKVKYDPSDKHPDPPLSKKENTLFWRGTTTEGYSSTGTWKGMVRQRLVHLANNATFSAPVLLPEPSDPTHISYQDITGPDLPHHPALKSSNFSLSFGFVSEMVRCSDGNCEQQDAEFGLVGGSDFQHHWKHRYLVDVDGAGFSGRFLPFLQSRSLPFKSALFREWYDDRITAWKHFVPIDLRLHGIWSTVAYFAGGFGRSPGPRGDPGETIAEAGREWANRVLRKEDMEIYFFRLLLEWGRLTDDRRDEIGFQV